VSALHTPAAAVTPTHLNVKPPDDHPRDRQFFLILCGDARQRDWTGTAGTVRWQRNVVPFVHARWTPATCLRSIRTSRLSAWTFRIFLQRLRERRRLAEPRPPRVVQLSFQVIDSMAEPFGFPLQSVTLTSQRVALAFRVLGTLAPISVVRSAIRVVRFRRFRHAPVMPEFIAEYKTPLLN
jgi:hypothetical protein